MKLAHVLVAVLALVLPLRALASEPPVLVFAASSLKNALDEVVASTTTGTRVSYAASSALARQVEHGAPADIFISADRDWMNHLVAAGLVRSETVTALLGNSLVLVVPQDDARSLDLQPGVDLLTFLRGGKLAMADVKSVPAGRYGKAALQSLGAWDAVEQSVVQAENVRAALKLVALKEAAVGIVYGSDALAEPLVRVAGSFAASSHPAIVYPVGLVSTSHNPQATQVLDLLKSAAARAIFRKHGFLVLPTQ